MSESTRPLYYGLGVIWKYEEGLRSVFFSKVGLIITESGTTLIQVGMLFTL